MHSGFGVHFGLFANAFGIDKNLFGGGVNRAVRVQPHVPIDTCAFVEPTLVLGSVYPYGNHVGFAKMHQIGNIVLYARIAAEVLPYINAIYPAPTVPKNTVELQFDAFASFGFAELKGFSIPTDTMLGEGIA